MIGYFLVYEFFGDLGFMLSLSRARVYLVGLVVLFSFLDGGVLANSRETPSAVSLKNRVYRVWEIIKNNYIDSNFGGKNWDKIGYSILSKEYMSMGDAYDSIRGMLKELGDPYTRFLDADELRAFNSETTGSLVGIGIHFKKEKEGDPIMINEVLPESPAFKVGLKPEDIILTIEGRETQQLSLSEASALIRGQVNTPVELTILRKGRTMHFKVNRERIYVPSVYSEVLKTESGLIGLIRLNSFNFRSALEMQRTLKNLESKDVKGYILDLRSNPGGLLLSSVEIARMFLRQGDIVSVVDRQGERERFTAGLGFITDKPLVVLINRESASASEILAGALQDHQRAIVVGNRSLGKGTVQTVYRLDEDTALVLTTAKYFTPSGRNIHQSGIMPDIEINILDPKMVSTKKFGAYMALQQDNQLSIGLSLINSWIKATHSRLR